VVRERNIKAVTAKFNDFKLNTSSVKVLNVVVGIIFNSQQEVLIARRPEHVHLGGYWEFPGGKIEPEEIPLDALKRELKEEIGIVIANASQLFSLSHAYPEHHVQLSVWNIERYSGEPCGREQQAIRWVGVDNLLNFKFPPANQEILTYLQGSIPIISPIS